MENLNESATQFQELTRRISEARTPEEFLEALDDVTVYLTAQREIAARLQMLSIHNAVHRRAAWAHVRSLIPRSIAEAIWRSTQKSKETNSRGQQAFASRNSARH